GFLLAILVRGHRQNTRNRDRPRLSFSVWKETWSVPDFDTKLIALLIAEAASRALSIPAGGETRRSPRPRSCRGCEARPGSWRGSRVRCARAACDPAPRPT